MAPELTNEAWAQIRYDYEHTERPIEDICAEHGISSGTLRDRRRRWGWALRRPPIPRDGPPPAPAPQIAAAARPHQDVWMTDEAASSPADLPQIGTSHLDVPPLETPYLSLAPHIAAGEPEAVAATPDKLDDSTIVPRLQSAVARVLPAIESIVAKLGAGPMQPRDMERAARALASLTRTLRELNSLLRQRQARPPPMILTAMTTCRRTSTRSAWIWREGSTFLSRPAAETPMGRPSRRVCERSAGPALRIPRSGAGC